MAGRLTFAQMNTLPHDHLRSKFRFMITIEGKGTKTVTELVKAGAGGR